MKKILAMAALLVAFAVPASAQFYIVQEKSTKKCTVVKEKPTTETHVIVNEDGVTYTTETEAMEAVKKVKVCTTS